jgi:transcriptional regulator with XRE-family HTH domain
MNHRKPFTELGEHLTNLIGSPTGNKLTYGQIGETLGVSKTAVHYWFTGRNRPDQKLLLKLCRLLNTTLENVEIAFTLADYYLSPEEIEQANAWQYSDQPTHELQTFNDLRLWLSAVRGLKSGTALEDGLRFAKILVERIQQLINEEGAKTRLLILYFDALDELTQFQNSLMPRELLRYVDLPSYLEMQRICEETRDQQLQARLLASQGDEDYVVGSHWASYRKLKTIMNLSLVGPELYIRPILRSSCLDLSHPDIGSDAEFHHVTAKLEAAIDKYSNTINPMLIVLALEGLSRAYATRYEHTCKKEYKKQAVQNLEAAETLAKQSAGYPLYELRVRKARLQLARSGVLDDLSLDDQVALAKDAKKVAEALRDSRSTKEMNDFLEKIEL